jgi:hypothetical protein
MRTNGHDEANSRFSQLCERVYKRLTVTRWSGNMNSAAIVFLAVIATKNLYKSTLSENVLNRFRYAV